MVESTQPGVSVIMPSFNSERHIAKAIRSVITQTLKNIELIVVDGGSRDTTLSIVQAFCNEDDRIVLIQNSDDQGPAHARSTGIRRARYDYIAFLDADDLWLPGKLSAQISFMKSTGAEFVYSRYRLMSEDERKISCLVPMRKQYTFKDYLGHRGIGTLTVILKKELLKDDVICEWVGAAEEMLWWLLILRNGAVARLCDEDVARYRNSPGSLSKYRIRTLRTVWNIYRKNLGLTIAQTASAYTSYAIDASLRRLRIMGRSKMRVSERGA